MRQLQNYMIFRNLNDTNSSLPELGSIFKLLLKHYLNA